MKIPEWLSGFFSRKRGFRHDCRTNQWGHACNLDPKSRKVVETGRNAGLYYECYGHLFPLVNPGDEVVVMFTSGSPVVCLFVEVRNCDDPEDMFFGTLKVLGYLEDVDAVKTA